MEAVEVEALSATLSPSQEFVMSFLLFLIVAVALTGLCSVILWFYFFVLFGHKQRNEKEKEAFV